ncbi:MAG: DUF58 domain-containing protein [Acidobacteria bacterium]|nr:DUF58 domain-containing protein [Acidobacteriota bacterium]
MRLAALLFLLGVAEALLPGLRTVWAVSAGLVLVAAGIETYLLLTIPIPSVTRTAPSTLPVGEPLEISLRVTNDSPRPLAFTLTDHPPADSRADGVPVRVVAGPGGFAEVSYRLTPGLRGDHSFGAPDLLIESPFDLVRRRIRSGEGQSVRIVPNVRAVTRFSILALEDRLGQMGVMKAPLRGEGMDFRELREYRAGDPLRRVDWKATSRRGQLVSREYQDEKDQRVVFLLDCGMRMRAKDGPLSHFDHVLNAVLLLAYVALRQGDSVGLATFSGDDRWLPPVKGVAGLEAIVSRVYDLFPSASPSDYLEAATALMRRQARRALVILVSNLRDEDSPELLPALRLLRTRHLVLLASLRETVLDEVLAKEPTDLREALRAGAVHHYLAVRKAALDAVREPGTISLDVAPAALPLALVNRYLEIKRAGSL